MADQQSAGQMAVIGLAGAEESLAMLKYTTESAVTFEGIE